jgi:hypothetical protein
MYTAAQAREDVKKYEDTVRITTLENLLNNQDNEIALSIFEAEIESMASKGNTALFINNNDNKPELYNLLETTDIKTILKFLGYKITINNKYYTITW